MASAQILEVNISHFLGENLPPEKILEFYSQEENIYYLALLDEKKEILGWSSRFEGYLPLSFLDLQKKKIWIIDSPAGKIFNYFSAFSSEQGKPYHLYLGYSLKNLEEMLTHSRQNFFFIFGMLTVCGIIFFRGLLELQKHYLNKKKEAEEEKMEKERFREISAFTSAVAHEIKNPLNSISLLFELLQKRGSPELRKEISLGKTEIMKVSRIIDQFSDYLKPLRLNRENCYLGDIILSARESLLKEFSNSRIQISYSEVRPILVRVDKGLMIQCLYNILKNSLEATDEGGVAVWAEKQKQKALIKITDSGRGIEEEEIKHIFEPFFSTKKKGMGIGLYLAKKIIEAHEGKIEVKSAPAKGTTFFIQVPGDTV